MPTSLPLKLAALCLASAAFSLTAGAQGVEDLPTFNNPPRPDRPNIVFIVADDLGYAELSCQGSTDIPTPHIDSIARDGVRFTNGYVTASYCSQSRAGFLTGRYATRFGYEFNPIGANNDDPAVGLPASETTLAENLHLAGYVTSLVGKWHLGATAHFHPIRRGFDEFFGFHHEGHYFVPPPWHGVTTMLRRKTLPNGGKGLWIDGKLSYHTMLGDEPSYDANNPIIRDGQPVVETEYLTDAFTREAVDFIDRHQRKPFFLYLSYNAVHSPLQGADAYMKKFAHIGDLQRRIFAAMLANMDDSVGAVLQKIRDAGLEQDTLVFFISDNGGPTVELTSSNLPLRNGKGSVHEGGLRVPFLVKWPGKIPAGVVEDRPVLSLDVFATAAAAAGTETRNLDGVDLLPHLDGRDKGEPHPLLFWRQRGRMAIRMGDWKATRNGGAGDPANKWMLYNLKNDIAETRDLSTAEPDKLAQLIREWEKMNEEMIDPFWQPKPRNQRR
ncbi:MAG: sulfatase-like hydrolase/transferase [Planctomycetota bacterium]|jgi:arylsulfatase B